MIAGHNSRISHGFGAPYTPSGGYRVDPRQNQSNMFPPMDESMMARVEASLVAAADIKSHPMPSHPSQQFRTEMYSHEAMSYMNPSKPQFGFNGEGTMGHMSSQGPTNFMAPSTSQFSSSLSQLTSMSSQYNPTAMEPTPANYPVYSHSGPGVNMMPQISHPVMQEIDCDPRELESFAERFKQRRIKLGVTQADVGRALGNLKLPGVGSLSQSTICRFESLTLSHNNMVALKPVLSAWLDDAERAARETQTNMLLDGMSLDKKRKRTSIAAPEKRSLEAYFAIQPRPSGEKIAQIADKLDLRKNVVRVWFCNQRQKQKRMKFAAAGQQH